MALRPRLRVRSLRAPILVLLASLATLWVIASPARAADSYTVLDVAPAAAVETTNTYPNWITAINASGWIAGNTTRDGAGAFLYDNSSINPIGTFGGSTSRAYGINASGAVVGFADTRKSSRAFRYSGGTITNLGALTNSGYSIAMDINDTGLIAGGATASTGDEHAFKYDTAMRDLGTLPGTTLSEARGVNSSGIIVGDSWQGTPQPADRAFRYAGSTMTDLGTLGGAFAEANDINDAGLIVGSSTTVTGQWHAFVYDGTMRDITPLAGFATALGINNRGEVVGIADGNAFLYSDGRFINLNTQIDGTPGWTLAAAHDINDTGQIVGVGIRNAQNRIFRLDLTLLARYLPEYRFSTQEPYYPAGAGLATDTYTPNELDHTNLLKLDGTPIAASDPRRGLSTLSLDYLGTAPKDAYIDEYSNGSQPGSSLQDYQDMLSRFPGQYNRRIYGRIISDVPGSGDTLLQYWAYYYYNWKTFYLFGDHEGDWEMIQVRLSSEGSPLSATYA